MAWTTAATAMKRPKPNKIKDYYQAETPVYGIVTDGKLLEFAQFAHNVLTKQIDGYTVSDLPRVWGVTKSIFDQAKLLSNSPFNHKCPSHDSCN